jgi:hypothetical protein
MRVHGLVDDLDGTAVLPHNIREDGINHHPIDVVYFRGGQIGMIQRGVDVSDVGAVVEFVLAESPRHVVFFSEVLQLNAKSTTQST